MKKILLSMALAILVVGLFAACSGNDEDDTADMPVLHIKDIQSDPLAFTGRIKITGVASEFSEDDATYFGVMDFAELMAKYRLFRGR
jgi:hypothetical protein